MRTSWMQSGRQRLLALIGSAVLVMIVVSAVLVIRSGGPEDRDRATPSASVPVIESAVGATQFRISSFNVLGSGHTAPGGDKKGYADGVTRMRWAVQILREQNISVVGFQELRPDQYTTFMSETAGTWGTWPGDELTRAAKTNSIAWRTDTWRLLEKYTIRIPYFDGVEIKMPYLKLQHRVTGQQVWVANFHNPANARGDAQKWRDEAMRRQIRLANRLSALTPGVPVYFTGDFNEREKVFCRFTRNTQLRASHGPGSVVNGVCKPPTKMKVDWVFGTAPNSFTGHKALRTALVQKTTDHPVIITDASVPPNPAQSADIQHVVVLSVEGLTSGAIRGLGAEGAPGMHQLITGGSSTLDARTARERTTSLTNVTSMLTGRPVHLDYGGHGVFSDTQLDGTVHEFAGRYVSSVFDMVHNQGRTTAFYAGDDQGDLIDRSWNASNGGVDPFWVDEGRDKIDTYVKNSRMAALGRALRGQLSTNPATFTFAQLDGPDQVGHASGFRSAAYLAAVTETDRQVRGLLRTINSSPVLAGRTLVILTSEHGGYGRSHNDATLLANHRIPFLVWGPGVPAGGDLYAMNPDLTAPGRARTSYLVGRPVRNAFVANLALSALRLPSLPGTSQNYNQNLNIFGPWGGNP